MKKLTLSAAQEKLLREQVIDADHPGTILRDFQTVLDFIGPGGVKAAGQYNLLPLTAIPELDRRLARPLRLTLKRPQLRSHPYLQGLNLLLRATGLGSVDGAGAGAQLVLDPQMLGIWSSMNSTERYFTLLEAWLVVGQPEMIGERGGWGDLGVFTCLQVWERVPARGMRFDLERPQEVYVHGIYREYYHLALADLFGLMEVEHSAAPVQPWRPAGLKHLSFGDAVFTLLWNRFSLSSERRFSLVIGEEREDPEKEARFGVLQPLFQPYFPAWKKVLVLPETGPRHGVFVFKVSLGKVWRLIAIPSSATLDDLAGVILDSVDFDEDHLYEFSWRDRFGAKATAGHAEMDEGPFAAEMKLGKLALSPGQPMKFLFDFGDNWLFDVKLERIDPPSQKMKHARVLESHGKAPEQYPSWEE